MAYILNYRELILGDIILERNDSRESLTIRKVTNGLFSHARLYVGGTIIESDGAGVQSVNPQRILYNNQEDVVVLRYFEATQSQLDIVCAFARSECGKEYSAKDAKKRTDKSIVDEPNREFCSRLVALAYDYAGIPIVEAPMFATPENLRLSSKLTIVNNMVHLASEAEIQLVAKDSYLHMDDTNKQAMIFGTLLQNMRIASNDENCDIQTETQLIEYLLNHPECDERFANVLRNSEYFIIWKKYEEANPEEFDASLMIAKYGPSASQVASSLLNSPLPDKVWKMQCLSYLKLVEVYQYELFKSFFEMYTNILDWHHRRLETLEAVASLSNI